MSKILCLFLLEDDRQFAHRHYHLNFHFGSAAGEYERNLVIEDASDFVVDLTIRAQHVGVELVEVPRPKLVLREDLHQ